ncbi:MAG: sulfite exporter TauE/SafE family protein [Actinobacteria bacterium]|nr:sulfite exporter TauE/SafE family protein [Actinomycetota bacterium]
MNPAGQAVALLGAGIVAGLVGSAGGITSLVSYPALLAVGIPALAANVTNIVALVACWPGSALASRPELAGRGSWLRRWAPVAALGGAAGSALLLSTPSGLFTRVVPFLVLAGSLALLAQPRLSARRQPEPAARRQPEPAAQGRPEPGPGNRLVLPAGVFTLSVYNGYFGAGSGVMTLALLLFTTDPDLPVANALKNMLIGAAALVSAVAFVIFGPVNWVAAAPLAAGMFAGSTLGPRVTRRLPAGVLRWAIVLFGVALAIQLWIKPSR